MSKQCDSIDSNQYLHLIEMFKYLTKVQMINCYIVNYTYENAYIMTNLTIQHFKTMFELIINYLLVLFVKTKWNFNSQKKEFLFICFNYLHHIILFML